MYMLEYGFNYECSICGVRKGVGSPKAEVTGCCEPPQLDAGNWTQNPCKSTTPLTEQSLAPLSVCHVWRGHRSTPAVFLNHTPLYFLRWGLSLSLGLLPIRLDGQLENPTWLLHWIPYRTAPSFLLLPHVCVCVRSSENHSGKLGFSSPLYTCV